MLPKPPTCEGCTLNPLSRGFMSPVIGDSEVLLVGEALGADEADSGKPFVGPAGKGLNTAILHAGFHRSDFSIANAAWCQPPNNKLDGEDYEDAAISHCTTHHLFPLIEQLKPKVIMPLGNVALDALLGEKGIMEIRGYPYTWRHSILLPSVHPSYIIRGNHAYESVLIRDLEQAMRIAREGWHPANPQYALDPSPDTALAWLTQALDSPHPLSYDIETPRSVKTGEDEQELDLSVPITRISFSSAPLTGMSIKATKAYRPVIERALNNDKPKIVWNAAFDNPILEAKGYTIGGQIYDGMIAWHVLHSALPKGLGFVASFLLHDQPRWKHLSRAAPAYYSAVDSDVALRCTLETFELLKQTNQWDHYQRYVLRMEPLYATMRRAGMPVDPDVREGAAFVLDTTLKQIHAEIEAVIPPAIKPIKLYKNLEKAQAKYPEGEEVEYEGREKRCSRCGVSGKLTAKHPCVSGGATLEEVPYPCRGWRVPQPFVVSPQRVLQYTDHLGHRAVRYKNKRTTNEAALRQLILRYRDDPFYPLVLDYREVQKLSGTYIGRLVDGKIKGGLPVGPDSRIHPTLTNNPDTLRTSMVHPNLQQIPRGRGLARLVKRMFVAPKGKVLWEVDFNALEALLVGYFAKSPELLRLSRLGVHDYINAYALYELDKVISEADLPRLEWSDADLGRALRDFKRRFPAERDVRKRLIHGHNYRMGPRKAQEVILKEMGVLVDVRDIKKFLDFKNALFPEIEQWHRDLCWRVDGRDPDADPGLAIEADVGWCRNPSGFVHRYHRVLEWRRLGSGVKTWSYGDSAKSLIAFNPQHAGAAIGKDALWTLYEEHPDVFADVRLFIHDSFVGESSEARVGRVIEVVQEVMNRPVKWLPLPAEWGMGEYLRVGTDAKWGKTWGEM